jgi:hypothetical protein
MALGSTQPPENISGGKDGRCLHHLHVPNVTKAGSLNLLETSGPLRAYYGAAVLFITFIECREKDA